MVARDVLLLSIWLQACARGAAVQSVAIDGSSSLTRLSHLAQGAKRVRGSSDRKVEMTYANAVFYNEPAGYWRLDDADDSTSASNVGSLNAAVDGQVIGDPLFQAPSLIQSDVSNMALLFRGRGNLVKFPNNDELNTEATGFVHRTVELWFQASSLNATKQVIYDEGGGKSGITIFAYKDGNGQGKLGAFVASRTDSVAKFGTAAISPDPVTCNIIYDGPYYVAVVFTGSDAGEKGKWEVFFMPGTDFMFPKPCGEPVELPVNAYLEKHGQGLAIGGIDGAARTSGTELLRAEDGDHTFLGIIDEVAIYNKPMTIHDLSEHTRAAYTARNR